MKLYKHTLISAALVLTGLGSAQAQLSSTCPIGMALVYTALTHIPFCVGVPSKVIGTGSSSGSTTSTTKRSSAGSAASFSAGSAANSAASFSAGSAAEDYIPVRPLAATGIFATTLAAPGQIYTNQDIATFLRDNGSLGAQQAISILGISPEQLAESQALMAAEKTSTFTDAQVAAYLRNNHLYGAAAQKAMDVFGVSPTQYADAQTMLAISNGTTDLAKSYDDAINAAKSIQGTVTSTQAPTQNGALTYDNEQVAAYLRDNNLSGAAAQNAMDVLGVSPKQYADAQTMLAISRTGTTGTPKYYTDVMNAAVSIPTAVPNIQLPSGLANYTPQQKADLYNTYLGQGLTDAQIRASVGPQTDSDWADLQQLAGHPATAPVTANVPTAAPPSVFANYTQQQKVALYKRLLESGNTDAQIRYAAGPQTDSDWADLQQLAGHPATALTPTQNR